MSIEVRQLLIRCHVVLPVSATPPSPQMAATELEALKERLQSDCQSWLREQIQQARER